jgi:hypothetical protein
MITLTHRRSGYDSGSRARVGHKVVHHSHASEGRGSGRVWESEHVHDEPVVVWPRIRRLAEASGLTLSIRRAVPSSTYPLRPLMTASASSSVDIMTKPKQRDSRV